VEGAEVTVQIERCADADRSSSSGADRFGDALLQRETAGGEHEAEGGKVGEEAAVRDQKGKTPETENSCGRERKKKQGGRRGQVKAEGEEHQEAEGKGGTEQQKALGADGLRFVVQGVEVEAFNGACLLEPCNEASTVEVLLGRDRALIRQALYALGDHEEPAVGDAAELLLALQEMAAGKRLSGAVHEGVVPEWLGLVVGGRSQVSKQVWRDVLLTITTRSADVIEIAPVNRLGGAARQAVRPMSEGTVLRILYALEALYPSVFRRMASLKWRLSPSGAAFVHLLDCLDQLARCGHDGDAAAALQQTPAAVLPAVVTELWPHQQEARDRVLQGIREGKLGFADASAVGAGKTLTALATICAVGEHLAARRVARHGSLVLVPVNELVGEWVLQAQQHCRNLHVIEQRANGKLFSATYKRGNPPIDANSLVISTLARVREHAFSKAAWDFVVIDECLSVQNDTALQTAEAWRQVEASQCGVLMLSATFFRSSYAKLFYMIRMLRSPLPREQRFLTTTLVEHIVCYVPKNRRTWKLSFEAVPLDQVPCRACVCLCVSER